MIASMIGALSMRGLSFANFRRIHNSVKKVIKIDFRFDSYMKKLLNDSERR